MSNSGHFEDRAPRPTAADIRRAQRRRLLENRREFKDLMQATDPLRQMDRELADLERRAASVARDHGGCHEEGDDL